MGLSLNNDAGFTKTLVGGSGARLVFGIIQPRRLRSCQEDSAPQGAIRLIAVRRPASGRSARCPVRLMSVACEPFMVLVASFTAVAYFAADPCSSSSPKPQPRMTLTGHDGSVGSVAFRPDGAMLSSVGVNGSVVLWDVATHQRDSFPPVGPGQHHCVAFSPDGKLLATASPTQAVALNNLEGDETWPLDDASGATAARNAWPLLPTAVPWPWGRRTGGSHSGTSPPGSSSRYCPGTPSSSPRSSSLPTAAHWSLQAAIEQSGSGIWQPATRGS